MDLLRHQAPRDPDGKEIRHSDHRAAITAVAIHEGCIQFHVAEKVWIAAEAQGIVRRVEFKRPDRSLENIVPALSRAKIPRGLVEPLLSFKASQEKFLHRHSMGVEVRRAA